MAKSSASSTSLTLLGQLRQNPRDQAAWGRFVALYGPKIFGWCRHAGLQEADALDVTQGVLIRLADKMSTFVYDPGQSFRAWLKTMTRNAWTDFWRQQRRGTRGSGDSKMLAVLETVEAREDLVKQLEEAFDGELLEQATIRVRLRVAPRTWDAFRLTALEGLPGTQAAAQLGMKVATVYVARSEVQKMLREEIQKLERGSP